MGFDVRTVDLAKINTMTKYRSTPTYHALDPGTGKLTETVAVDFEDEPVVVTEKLDGSHARIILFPDGSWLIGSREELLTAAGDLVPNPAQGIVAALDDAVVDLAADWPGELDTLEVLSLEVYGGKTSTGSKNYTGGRNVGVALFDVAVYDDWRSLLDLPIEEIARWRDRVGPRWVPTDRSWCPFEVVPTLPDNRWPILRHELGGSGPPQALAEARAWMELLLPDRKTECALDEGAKGIAEGVVVRTADRGKIAKLKFRDYDRALGGAR